MTSNNKTTKEELKKQRLALALKKNILRRKASGDTIAS